MNIRQITVGTFVFIIIFVFTFSGFKTSKFFSKNITEDTAFIVGNETISKKEIQKISQNYLKQISNENDSNMNEYQLQMVQNFVSQMMVENTIFYVLAKKEDLSISNKEITEMIKKVPAFQENNTFNLTLYKNLLNANGYTPERYEQERKKETLSLLIKGALNSLFLSKEAKKDVLNQESIGFVVDTVKIEPNDLISSIEVSEDQINDFIKNSYEKITTNYTENNHLYNLPGEYKVAFLALESLSEEERKSVATYSQFVSLYKAKNGDFNSIPENHLPDSLIQALSNLAPKTLKTISYESKDFFIAYEDYKPAKKILLSEVDHKIAKQLIQEDLTEEKVKLYENISKKVEEAFKNSHFEVVKKIAQKYNLSYKEKDFKRLVENSHLKDASLGFYKDNNELFYIHKKDKIFSKEEKEYFQKSIKNDLLTIIKVKQI